MDDSDLAKQFEAIGEQMVPWICERTGIARETVDQVFAAQAVWWNEHPEAVAFADSLIDDWDGP